MKGKIKMADNFDRKIKHLEMIENVIERMAKNCFQLKGWAITLVTLVGALGAKESDKRFMLLAFVPIIGFWILDAFYLQQERRYRALYRSVCDTEPDKIDFNLNTRNVNFTDDEAKRICFFDCLKSTSVSLFYGILAITLVLLVAVLKSWITI